MGHITKGYYNRLRKKHRKLWLLLAKKPWYSKYGAIVELGLTNDKDMRYTCTACELARAIRGTRDFSACICCPIVDIIGTCDYKNSIYDQWQAANERHHFTRASELALVIREAWPMWGCWQGLCTHTQ